MNITLAQPRGFCAGVVRAIETVEIALKTHGAPIYVFHEIVHNQHVVDRLREQGAIFVEDITAVPEGEMCIFSAHGVATKIIKQAQARQLHAVDATCPLVTKVHAQAQRYHRQGYDLVIVGHAGHPEVEGTRGQVDGKVHVLCQVEEVNNLVVKDPDKIAYVTQTTLSLDDTRTVITALKKRFPNIQGPDLEDICYATQNRQNAVRDLADSVDVLLVVGASNSSNSNRLSELGKQLGIDSHLIESADNIQVDWFKPNCRVGLTAGASAPEYLVQAVVDKLQILEVGEVKTMQGVEENMTFRIPVAVLKKT